MKHLTTTLLLTLLVLSGCTMGEGLLYRGYILDSSDEVLLSRITDESSVPVVNDNFEIPEDFIFIRFNLLNNENSFLEAYISPRIFERVSIILGGVKKIKDGFGPHAHDTSWIRSAIRIYDICEELSGDICLLDEFNGESYIKEALTFTCSAESVARYNNNIEMQEKILNASRCLPFIQEEENKRRIALNQKKEEEEQMKQDAFNKLYSTCLSYGFEERDSIASCIQQEIFNEKKLALLKQQQLAQIAYANQQQIQEQEETSFWLLLLEGVAENLADPNTWENARQNAEIQKLKKKPTVIYKNCPDNYVYC